MVDIATLPPVPPETRWLTQHVSPLEKIAVDIDFTDLASKAVELAEQGRSAQTVQAHEMELGSAEVGLGKLADVLDNGRGLALVSNFPVDLPHGAIEFVFWRCGLALGNPVSQSVLGDRLGHVIDVTKTDPHARAYRRSEELTPHTDLGDYLSFLCLEPAPIGGESMFVSALEVHERLRADRPDLLERLYNGYHYSRFGEQPDGEAPITPHRVPVFQENDGFISTAVVRQYIEIAADEDPNITLDALDTEALDYLDATVLDPELAVRFTLERGQAVFANNYTVWHARTSFSNDDGAPPRHLLRLWIEGTPGRPIDSSVFIYPGVVGIAPQPGRTPSYETTVDVI